MQVEIDPAGEPVQGTQDVATAPVLHISYVKSGSYFLWSVLDRMFKSCGQKRSFVQEHPIQAQRDAWPDFSIEQFDIDQVMIVDDGTYWQVETQHIEAIGELDDYLAACSHVWTHSYLCYRSWEVYPRFARRCYIVRDPRDALVSMAHFVQTPFMRRYHPHPASSPEGYVELELVSFLEDWCRHASEHRRARHALDIEWIRYEDMRADLPATIRRLAALFKMPLREEQVRDVAESCGLSKMRLKNPQHVRNGSSGGFGDLLTPTQQQRALEVAGPTMRELGYDVGF